MSKFVMECPRCGKYVEARTGFFARKKIDCSCGYTIDVRTDRMTTRTCGHCGNDVVYDQSLGADACCPVCGSGLAPAGDPEVLADFACGQCGIRLHAARSAAQYTCPVCDHVNDLTAILTKEKIRRQGLASVIRYEGDSDTLVWKHPMEDFNMGTQLIVHESQEAIFFRDGQALDLFGAGRYTLDTQQLPILEKIYHLPTDSEATFHSEVYFCSLTHQLAVKWGTPEKVTLLDPQTQAPISLGARGVMNFRVADFRKLLLKLVGTTGGLSRQQLVEDGEGHIQNYFRSVIQLAVATNLAQIVTAEHLDILQIDQQRMRLSAAMLEALQPSFTEYGLVITEFLVMGIMLPQRGELGYDALQTIIQLRQKTLTKSAIETETELKLAELEAKKQLDIRIQQNMAEVELAHRNVIAQQGESSVLEAQYAGQKKLAEATADVGAERLRMQLELDRKAQEARISAEEMRLKGYTQRDVLQADVQKAFAEGIGNMGPAISAGGGGAVSGLMGDVLGLGVTMAAAGAVTPQIRNMMDAFQGAAAPAAGWDCPACGQRGVTTKFCPNCGAGRPEPKTGWTCPQCGKENIVSQFCPDCGTGKPEEPKGWDCTCGCKNIMSRFCPECGSRQPESGWTCPGCGAAGIRAKFCPDCGTRRPE